MCVLRDRGVGQILAQPVYPKASRIMVAWDSGRQMEGLFTVSLGQVTRLLWSLVISFTVPTASGGMDTCS